MCNFLRITWPWNFPFCPLSFFPHLCSSRHRVLPFIQHLPPQLFISSSSASFPPPLLPRCLLAAQLSSSKPSSAFLFESSSSPGSLSPSASLVFVPSPSSLSYVPSIQVVLIRSVVPAGWLKHCCCLLQLAWPLTNTSQHRGAPHSALFINWVRVGGAVVMRREESLPTLSSGLLPSTALLLLILCLPLHPSVPLERQPLVSTHGTFPSFKPPASQPPSVLHKIESKCRRLF